jgi:rod shape-determining protein MreC
MASKVETGKNRAPLVFVILLIVQLLSMSWHARARGSEISLLRSWLLTAAYPVQVAFGKVGNVVSKVWYGYIYLVGASAENQELHTQNDQMRQELFRLREEVARYNRAGDISRVQQVLPYKSQLAHVIARSGSEFFNQVIIDVGSRAGLHLNQPVITPGGVVGRIVGIGPVAAQVQLITDNYAGLGAQLAESRAYGEVKGIGKPLCEMRNVSGLEPVKEGEGIITTGLDGIYPKGLLIGYVEHLTLGSGAKNHQITVRPAAGLDRLEEVLVLQLTDQDLRIDETVK